MDESGTAWPVSAAKQRIMLAALLLSTGSIVSAASMADALWDGPPPPNAPAVMRTYVMRLRRALGPVGTRIVGRPPGLGVELRSPGELDLTEVDYLWRAARAAAEAGEWQQASSLLAKGLSRWRGEPLIDVPSAALGRREAGRLAELRLQLTEARIDADLRLGRHGELVAELRRLAAEHPLREHVRVQLMLASYRCGHQAAALQVYLDARKTLADELGLEPGHDLREMHQRILTADPDLMAWTPPPVTLLQPGADRQPARREDPAPPSSPAADRHLAGRVAELRRPAEMADPTPAAGELYVGRDAELRQVTRSAAQAAAGRTRVVLVAGDAGAGKTALADRVSQQLAEQGWTVALGRCPEHEGAPAGWPWAEAIRRLARVVPPAQPKALAALLTDTPPAGADMAAARFQLHRAVARYLDAVSKRAPLLVVLDDVHRADDETLAILADVAADLAASAILVLVTYRPAEVGEQLSGCLAALAAREPVRTTLRGLDEAAAGELVRAICARPADGAMVRMIAERTGGNPFFIKETARLLDSEGVLAAATEVPAGIREVLQQRIARLPPAAQAILRQASVIGAEIDVDVLGDVAEADEHVLLDAIEAGLLAGLVTEPAAGRIRFAHALVRETLYTGLSQLRCSRLHTRAAEAIERRSPGAVAALAYHYLEAGTAPRKAAHYCGLAARQAEQRFAYHEAARLWERAIACCDQADAPGRERLELVMGLVRTLASTGQLTSARPFRRDAVRAALPLDDPGLLAQVIASFDVPITWFSHEYGSIDDELIATIEQTLDRLPAGDGVLRCRLLTTLAFELEGAASERGYQASLQAVEMARRLGDPIALTMAINGRYLQSFRYDGQAERLSLGAELLALPGKPVTVEAIAHLLLMAASSGVGDYDSADLHAGQAARIADRYDLRVIGAMVSIYRAMRTGLDGDVATAGKLYEQVADQINRLGLWRQGAGVSVLGRMSLLITQDRAAEMNSELDGYPWMPVVFPELYALALADSGRVIEARATASRANPIRRDRFHLFMTCIRGLLAIALDDRELAQSAYQALLPHAARPAGAETGVLTLGPTVQVLGDLARYLGLPSAEGHYRHALAIAEQARVEPWREAATRRLSGPLSGRAARRASSGGRQRELTGSVSEPAAGR
ncbi:MAG TPA: BTAD domain-containing putative transcriptional regulator [Trebonia sp.]|nr:BTAD domain-containing putative transcriptional regulator [Trebonia sp.]